MLFQGKRLMGNLVLSGATLHPILIETEMNYDGADHPIHYDIFFKLMMDI